jgi:hypothetical protein
MTTRQSLLMSPLCRDVRNDFGALSKRHTMAVGYYEDGQPGEVFIMAAKARRLRAMAQCCCQQPAARRGTGDHQTRGHARRTGAAVIDY